MHEMLREQYALGAKTEAAVKGGSTTAASAPCQASQCSGHAPGTQQASKTKEPEDKNNTKAESGEQKAGESRSKRSASEPRRGRKSSSRSPRRRGAQKDMSTSSQRSLEELNRGNVNAGATRRRPSRKRNASQKGEDAPPNVSRQLPERELNVAHADAPPVSA